MRKDKLQALTPLAFFWTTVMSLKFTDNITANSQKCYPPKKFCNLFDVNPKSSQDISIA
jgi:hypothetical protein